MIETDDKDNLDESIIFRLPISEKALIKRYCLKNNLNFSIFLRMIIKKFLEEEEIGIKKEAFATSLKKSIPNFGKTKT